jgi:hypothetical protein
MTAFGLINLFDYLNLCPAVTVDRRRVFSPEINTRKTALRAETLMVALDKHDCESTAFLRHYRRKDMTD